jgi:hypothetical protein
MPAANVPLVIDQGEDFTAQIIWTDDYGNPQNMTRPIRMDIKGAGTQPILSLETPDVEPADGTVPEISFSNDIGMVQIHISASQTAALNPGHYIYDLFVTVEDNGVYAGAQRFRLMAGSVIVNKRITVM